MNKKIGVLVVQHEDPDCFDHKELSVCGELAHEPEYIPFLLGIGVRNLSVYPKFLAFVQNLINGLKISASEVYAKRLLAETTIDGVCRALKRLSSISQTEPRI